MPPDRSASRRFSWKNSAERNHADPRLEPAQTRVDTAIAKAHERGDSTQAIGGIGEAVRQRVAEQIRTGEKLNVESVRVPDGGIDVPAKDESRGR